MKKLLAILLLLLISCGNNNVAGSSSDVDIITGILVTSSGAKIPNASVTLYNAENDSSLNTPIDTVYTDSVGHYQFNEVGAGRFDIHAISSDSLLVGARNNIAHEGTTITDLAADTLLAPGTLMGTVQLDRTNSLGILVYIPGTSFSAFTDSLGSFTISKIPAEKEYTVAFQMYGYATNTVQGIKIERGDTTVLDTVTLIRNSYPTGVTATYNHETGTVTISWDPFNPDETSGYIIYRKNAAETGEDPQKVSGKFLCTTTSFTDTINEELFSRSDSILFQYHVKAKNTNEELTPFSNKALAQVYTRRDSSTQKTLNIDYPAQHDTLAGQTEITLQWVYTGLIDSILIELTTNNGKSWFSMIPPIANSGYYTLTVPNISSDSCRIRITEVNSSIPKEALLQDPTELFSIKADTVSNLLINSDFSQGTSNWQPASFYNSKLSFGVVDGECITKVSELPDSLWYINIHQGRITLLSGNLYRLTFEARSSEETHPIDISLGMGVSPWTTYDNKSIVIDTIMKKYSVDFNMGHPDDLASVLSIFPAEKVGTLYFDNFKLERIVR